MKPRPREIDIREISAYDAQRFTGPGWMPYVLGSEEYFVVKGRVWCRVISTGFWFFWSEHGLAGEPGWRGSRNGPLDWDP